MISKATIVGLLASTAVLRSMAAEPVDSLFSEEYLQQVVVTGTRSPKMLAKSPVLTHVITAKDIEKSDATNIRDLLQQVMPGVEFSYSMNQMPHMNFSGFSGQSMLILVDGERLAGETMEDVDFARLDMQQVDHIEIIKGAASALYGSNAAGGVINIITKKTSKPFALNFNARLARHNDQRYGMVLQNGGKALHNVLTIRRTAQDNYNVESAANPVTRVISTIYGDKTWNFEDRLAWTPTKQWTVTGRAGYFFRQVARSEDTPERYRDFNGGLTANWKPTKHDQMMLSYVYDQYDKSDYQRITKLDVRDYSNVQNTFKLIYNHYFANDNVLTAGADYMHDYMFNTKLDGSTRRQNSFDVFTQFDWNVCKQLEMVGAVRYDYFSDNDIQRVTPKFSLRYEPLHNLNIRFGYGMGFRAPTLKEKYYAFDIAGIWTLVGNPALKPEISHNHNLSVEYTHGNYTFMVNGTFNRVKNKIGTGAPYFANASDELPTLPYINLANYKLYGADASVQARLWKSVTAKLSYAFVHEEFPKDKEGKSINNQYIPARKHSLTAHIDWDHTFSTHYGLNIALDGRYLSSVDNKEFIDYYDINKGLETIHYPAYTLWKLQAVSRIEEGIKVTVALDNLFNYKPKYYYLNCPLTDGCNLMVGLSIDVDKLF